MFVLEYYPEYFEWVVDEVSNPLLVGTQRSLTGAVEMAFTNGAQQVSINLKSCFDKD